MFPGAQGGVSFQKCETLPVVHHGRRCSPIINHELHRNPKNGALWVPPPTPWQRADWFSLVERGYHICLEFMHQLPCHIQETVTDSMLSHIPEVAAFLLKFYLFYLICLRVCLSVCVCAEVSMKARRHWTPWNGSHRWLWVVSNHMGVGNWTPGPLHERQLLVTPDPSFHFSYTLPPPFPWFSLSLGWGGGDIHTPSVAGHSTSFILCTLTVRSLKQGSLKKGVGGGFGDSTCWGLLNHILIWTLMTQSQSTCSPRSFISGWPSVGY